MVPLLLGAAAWQDQRGRGSLHQYLQSLISIKAPRGDIAVFRHPTGSSLALPGGATMSKASTAALRPGRASKQKQSRLWADEGENLYENKLEQEARQ